MNKSAIILFILFAICGCDNQELYEAYETSSRQKMEIVSLNEQNALLNKDMHDIRARAEESERENKLLIEKNLELIDKLTNLEQELTQAREQYESLKSAILKKRQEDIARHNALQKQREEMLRKVEEEAKKAKLPAEYPYRIFDVQHIGTWSVNNEIGDYGRFSVRNYTAKYLEGFAIALGNEGNGKVNLRIPPNSVETNIYFKAQNSRGVKIVSNLGNKEAQWGKGRVE